MATTPRPIVGRRTTRLIARASAIVAVVGAISLALPALSTIAPDAPLPSSVAEAADSSVRLDKRAVPVRVRVPYAGIDLPVVSSRLNVPGNRAGYPLCDVAQYWTKYDLPGAPGTTWLLAHAQPGMFLPLFTISEETDGKGLLGKVVELQLKDGRLLRYRIIEVKERATDQDIADRPRPGQHRLVLQTSTGPAGTRPKLHVAARLIDAERTDEKAPKAQPRACWQPRPTKTPRGSKKTPKAAATATAEPAGGSLDTGTLVLGSGAVLLGATVVAVYAVRRQP